MPTYTPFYNLAKPLVNSPVDEDLWGSELNDNMDIIDTTMHDLASGSGGAYVVTGTVLDFAGAAAPTGYLLCYGQAVSRATYADLFTAIGVLWGAGDGSTTFNIPDLRGRIAAGKDDMGGSASGRLTAVTMTPDGITIGAIGGAQTHTLTTAQLASHNHGVTDPGHNHSLGFNVYSNGVWGNNTPGTRPAGTSDTNSQGSVSGNTGSKVTGLTVNNAGSGDAHNNVQPTAILNKIIKV